MRYTRMFAAVGIILSLVIGFTLPSLWTYGGYVLLFTGCCALLGWRVDTLRSSDYGTLVQGAQFLLMGGIPLLVTVFLWTNRSDMRYVMLTGVVATVLVAGTSDLLERFLAPQFERITARHITVLTVIVALSIVLGIPILGVGNSVTSSMDPVTGHENIFTGECQEFSPSGSPWYYEKNEAHCGPGGIQHPCSLIATRINREYCGMYLPNEAAEHSTEDVCADIRSDPAPGHNIPVDRTTCTWQSNPGGVLDHVLEDGEPIVIVQGEEHNCREYGYIEPECPA